MRRVTADVSVTFNVPLEITENQLDDLIFSLRWLNFAPQWIDYGLPDAEVIGARVQEDSIIIEDIGE